MLYHIHIWYNKDYDIIYDIMFDIIRNIINDIEYDIKYDIIQMVQNHNYSCNQKTSIISRENVVKIR